MRPENILIFQLLNDVQIGLLRCCHAGMSQAAGDAGDGYPGKKQERRVGMAKAVNGDNGYIRSLAVPGQNGVDG